MGNLAGVTAILSVLLRPALVVPHIQTPDIRHLDWTALHASGVRFLVFDKDNCLAAPHSDHLEPALIESWAECQRIFGRENILIVSNSSGSTDDPSGLGAESLSRALGVPVLCHSQKKPGLACVREAMEYFVRLSLDPEGTVREGQKMPPGCSSSPSSFSNADGSWLERRKLRKMLCNSIPRDATGSGSILLVGDRTMTDVVLAHRMDDELARRWKTAGIDTEAERIDYDAKVHGIVPPAAAVGTTAEPMTTFQTAISTTPAGTVAQAGKAAPLLPPPQCISVLTTSLWANEGRINTWMRSLETRITLYLLSRDFQPGQRGFWSPTRDGRGRVDWQSIAVLQQPKLSTAADVDAEAADLAATAGEEKVIASAAPEPTLGALLWTAMLRPLPPRLASMLRAIIESRPVAWVTYNMKEGWNVIIKGLQFGVREAGLLDSRSARRVGRKSYQVETEEDPLLPPSRRKTPTLRSFLASPPPARSAVLDRIRWPQTTMSSSLVGRRGTEACSASKFLERLNSSRSSPLSSSGSNTAQRNNAPSSTAHHPLSRTFSTSRVSPASSKSKGPGLLPPPNVGKVPLRNWIAAFSALVLVPTCYYTGSYLHELQDLRKAERELMEKKKLQVHTRNEMDKQMHLASSDEFAVNEVERVLKNEEKLNKARVAERTERKKALELSLYHLNHEREEILDKLHRIQARIAESSQPTA